jgi:hypothetical protein
VAEAGAGKLLSNSWLSVEWMSPKASSMAASLFIASEAGSGVWTLGISGCMALEASGWSMGTEEGSRFGVGEDGALK